MGLFDDVGDFHRKFGLDNDRNTSPTLLPEDVNTFRIEFMMEELNEFRDAIVEDDLYKAADALIDLVYVALGTAHMMGLPFEDLWAAVQRANMAKERATGGDDARSKRRHSLDVVKPEGWRPPDEDIRRIIEERIRTGPTPRTYRIEHDGFVGTRIGDYVTREGKRGVVLQQVGTRVVHVYGERWIVDGGEGGRE